METKYTDEQKEILRQSTKGLWESYMTINKIAPELVTFKVNKTICDFIMTVDMDRIKMKR